MKNIFLLITVLILLSIIYFLNNNYLENFNNGEKQIRTKIKEPQSPPLQYYADDVPQLYRLQRIYPFGGSSEYSVGKYPNVTLPGDVVGCGSRREPSYGGSQEIVGNILPPLNISNKNISPRNGHIGPYPPYQQVGYLYKIMAPYEQNNYQPLYLKRIKPNTQYPIYKYFTIDTDGQRQNVIIPSPYRELGTNDQVKLEGHPYFYRVTINHSNFPSYPRVSTF